ncbi:MAG: response regulator [Pseudomonadota bacterium]|nr:response regulator [Pseudomonadota bacterium]
MLAVPLGLVARLEHLSRERIEGVPGRWVTQYRGRLMPLVCVDPEQSFDRDGTGQPVLVFTESDRSMGLVVDEILDVVTDRLHIELSSARAGVLGSAVITGRAMEILDTGYWLAQAGQDWFRPMVSAGGRPRLLAVEDSEFFRQKLVPTLAAAGYEVTTVDSAEEALALRAAGERFEVIVSDIEMAGLSGLSFAREIRDRGAWATTPMVALSGRASAADVAAGRAAGFTEYVAKLDRPSLIAALQRCFHAPVGVSA